MATFSISSVSDWYTAIVDSQLVTPVYTTYKLTAALTFTSTSPPYLSTGTLDTQYLYLTSGQTFNGQGYLILLQNGCEPSTGIAGIFRAVGTSGNVVRIININIQGASGLPWDVSQRGSVFVSNFSDTYAANYVTIQYGIVQAATSTTSQSYTSWVLNSTSTFPYVQNITMDSVYMYLNGSVGLNGSFFQRLGGTSCSFSSCVFSCTSLVNFGSICRLVDFGVVVTLTNCYFYLSNQPSVSNSSSLIAAVDVYASITMTNTYMVFSTYSTASTSDIVMIASGDPNTITLTDIYTNNTTFTITGNGDVIGSATTSFLFSSAPTFASPNGFQSWVSARPNLLTAFTTSPFNASAYTVFNSLPAFSTVVVPCLARGMKVLTPQGPVPVELLKKGDTILAPPKRYGGRVVPIQSVFFSTVVGTPENAPVRIPAHFFEHNIPNEDVVLSPHHAVFYNGKWRIPKHIPGLQQDLSWLGKPIEYYHLSLPDYALDKVWCHNLAVDSWDGSHDSF